METKEEQTNTTHEHPTTIVVPSKKIQINAFDHELATDLHKSHHHIHTVTCIKIEGNSYSL